MVTKFRLLNSPRSHTCKIFTTKQLCWIKFIKLKHATVILKYICVCLVHRNETWTASSNRKINEEFCFTRQRNDVWQLHIKRVISNINLYPGMNWCLRYNGIQHQLKQNSTYRSSETSTKNSEIERNSICNSSAFKTDLQKKWIILMTTFRW